MPYRPKSHTMHTQMTFYKNYNVYFPNLRVHFKKKKKEKRHYIFLTVQHFFVLKVPQVLHYGGTTTHPHLSSTGFVNMLPSLSRILLLFTGSKIVRTKFLE